MGLTLKPDFSETYSNLGVAYHDSGSLESAVRAFETAIRFRPDFAEAHFNQGRSLEALKQHAKASVLYTQALIYKPVSRTLPRVSVSADPQDYPDAWCTSWRIRAALCDWKGWQVGAQKVRRLARRTVHELRGTAACPQVQIHPALI